MIKQFHCLTGLPRSGSTLLSSLLSQNPNIHASQNSTLITLLWHTIDQYEKEEATQAFRVENQLHNTLFYMAHGFYSHINKPVIVDKSRAWAYNFSVAKESFRNNPKLIATVRSIPDILASFISLANKNPNNYIDKTLKQANIPITDDNRCEWLVSKNGTLFESWESLNFGFTHHRNNILIVEYDDLSTNTDHEMKRIYDFIEQPYFKHDLTNIVNQTPENDDVYGIKDFHTIRKELHKSPNNALDILGKERYNRYNGGEFWRS
jgi:sulfotransferase